MSVDELVKRSFDYVVIGGGTSGLTVAARLAEDARSHILVLEAGPLHLNDPLIDLPGQYTTTFFNPKYDWCLKTTPQENVDGRVIPWCRGKGLGGTSAMNYMVWGKPTAEDIDAWERLGNPGWNWNKFQEYSTRTERFIPPSQSEGNHQSHEKPSHGEDGPLITSFPQLVLPCDTAFIETMGKLGVPAAKNPLGGDPIGSSMTVMTADPATITRTYSTTAFYLPNKDKPNFKVLCEANVQRIISTNAAGEVVATAIQFEHNEQVYTVSVGKEVIVSAGALKTPQILELSGIGNKDILAKHGIPLKVDLPGVGENVQDHITTGVVYELKPGIDTLTMMADEEFAAEQRRLHASKQGLHCLGLNALGILPLKYCTPSDQEASKIVQMLNIRLASKQLTPALQKQYAEQLKKLESGAGGECEILCYPTYMRTCGIPEPGKSYYTILGILNHPISRGNIHLTSNDPNQQPAIDPHYLEDDFDLDILMETVMFIRRLGAEEPFSSHIVKEASPGPDCNSEEDLRKHVKKSLFTAFHTIGSASMLPREMGGVVDDRLKVYGTKNIRVVDISIIPLHIAAHTQSSAYAIAERAADIIRDS